jgi:hypothetical protein
MTDVRNQRLRAYTSVGDQWVMFFQVPDNWVCILKHIQMSSFNTVPVQMEIMVETEGTQYAFLNREVAGLEIWSWEGSLCMNPGDNLKVHFGAAGIAIWSSGAMLSGGPPWPVMPTVAIDPVTGR